MQDSSLLINFGRLFKLVLKNNKKYVFTSFLFIISSATLPFINIIYFSYLFDAIIYNFDLDYIINITIWMLVANLIMTNIQIFTKSSTTLHSKWLLIPLTSMFCKKSIEMDYRFTEDQSVIAEMDRAKYVLANGDNLEQYLAAVNGVFTTLLQFIIIIILSALLNPYIIVLVLLVSILNTYISARVRKKNYELHKESLPVDYKWRYIIKLASDLKYAKEVRLFSLKNFITNKTKENRQEFFSYIDKQNKNERNGLLLTTFTGVIQEIFVITLLVFLVIFKGLTIGNFNLLLNITRQFSTSFVSFFDHVINIYTINNYLSDFFGFINRKSELRSQDQDLIIENFDEPGKFEFKDVSFHYPDNQRPILKNINLTIEPGESLVIVGENGAGKTTLISLLMRLYDVSNGAILYNGIDIRKYNYDSYMKLIATVFQDYKIFATSLYENITFKENNNNDNYFNTLLDENNLSAKVRSLSEREQTALTRTFDSSGVELSGGQSQRVAFCRAMYKQSPILILDEPSASLSPIAENDMYVQFAKVIKRKTSIFISHRLSSSSISDKICVLDNGQIVEYGTHQELMKNEGLYREMYELQSKYYIEEASSV
ncbi:ABC transporter ATP-binding protein (plasmid) [Alkalihalophilus pseudofirmus]|uniref:ABC transporter ATP-binding protein n=1 Tax=Alkalihalophilus pseudofirmus TaxID=79885 RepID=UPI00259B94FE|nr:ABC transporter ATP-binding protein [Alkalihalophilus pseudofirmus]WEG19169.1 ABC transporter ATP-binding protein [Alkalihalophilus pseudofirmus]